MPALNFFTVSQIINVLASVMVGAFVLYKNPKSAVSRQFSYFCFGVIFWAFGYFFWQLSTDYDSALFWARFLMAGAALPPLYYLTLVVHFLDLYNKKFWKIFYWSATLVSYCFVFINFFTDLQVRDLTSKMVFKYWLVQGAAFIPFLIVFFGLAIIASFLLTRAHRQSIGVKKMQLAYMLCGIGITFVSGSTNYFLFFDISILPYGNILVPAYLLFIGYAITRYRYMDIRVVLKKSIVYGSALVGSLIVFLAVAVWAYIIFDSILVWAVALLLIVFFHDKYKIRVKHFLDGIFFMDELDLSKNISAKVKQLNSTHELETWVLELAAGIQDAVNADVLYIFVARRAHQRLAALYPKNTRFIIPFDNELLACLPPPDKFFIAEELANANTTTPRVNAPESEASANMQKRAVNQKSVKTILKFMRKHRAAMMMQVTEFNKIIGLVLVGPKKNLQPFTTDEIKSLERLNMAAHSHLSTVLYWHETLERVKRKLKEDEY